MRRFASICVMSVLAMLIMDQALATDLDDLYTSVAIVTGQGAKNRQLGFRACLDRVLVRVSGDPRLPNLPQTEQLRARAGDFVASFSYHDRLAGKPVHDEQGTYDRPHDLACRYQPQTIDGILSDLGSKPWLAERPTFMVILDVDRSGQSYRVVDDNARDLAMREAFAAAATPLALKVTFPTTEAAKRADADTPTAVGADLPLVGRLTWSDPDLGWVATWRLSHKGKLAVWTVRGVNFDEAFRAGMRGAAQVLSGNGTPM